MSNERERRIKNVNHRFYRDMERLTAELQRVTAEEKAASEQAAARNREAMKLVGSGRLVRRFGMVICELRNARGLSGPGLAALAGIGKGHLSKIENHGGNVSLETIEKLAAALQVTPAILMTKCAAPNQSVSPSAADKK